MGTRTPPATFADLLQRYRRAAGLTQEELAERAHLSVRGISNLERGVRRLPQRGTVTLLIEALGLAEAERAAFEAAARGLDDPSPKTLAESAALTVPTNLPLTLTSFVGRQREIATVRRLLGETRLLTLTGAGGCGKTRLALEVARVLTQELDAYADGIWLAELAALGDGTLIPQALATVLGLREQSGESMLASLTTFLQPKRVLLLLDNCEHLVAACAGLAEALLRVCPHLSILATSREALGVGGERPWRVPSLRLPDARGILTIKQTLESEAVALFVQRAQVVSADFTLTVQNCDLVAQVCRRLDGIPLALELAAARLAYLPLAGLGARLNDLFRLLTSGSRTALPRQQTLRATLDWSHDLLSELERSLFRRLSVFAAGWTLEAAEAICSSEGIAEVEVLDLLTGLVNKSLVTMEERVAGARYRLLETVRQYGQEQLATAGEAPRLRDRHLEWCLALAKQAEPWMAGPDLEGWLGRLDEELDNLRAALAWSTTGGSRPETGLWLAEALREFWFMRGHVSEGRRWLEDLLQQVGAAAPATRARALDALGELVYYQGDAARSMALHEAAYALHSSEGNAQGATWTLAHLARVALSLGEYQRATTLLDQVLPAHREHGDRHGLGWALSYVGYILQGQGDYAQEATRYEESLAVFQELGDKSGSSIQIANLANAARALGDYERAKQLYRESLSVRRAFVDKFGFALCFEGLAVVAAAEGQPSRAARLFGAAQRLHEASGTPVYFVNRTAYDRTVADARAALGEEAFATAWAEGRAMELDDAVALALETEPID
jgi:predicted ATPase/DNA-binding XRE family transcriptional regulator